MGWLLCSASVGASLFAPDPARASSPPPASGQTTPVQVAPGQGGPAQVVDPAKAVGDQSAPTQANTDLDRGDLAGQPAGPGQGDQGLGDIVVTARRREESLLQAPVTVTAFSAEAIRARDIRTLNDIAAFTPAVTITNQGGARVDRSNQTFIIRGMNPQSSNTASVFIDGAPVTSGFVEGLDDAARVEILKGPQSAAFGRQAFAGAVNIVTKDPASKLGGRVDGTFGSDAQIDVRAMLEGPIVPGLLSFRISPRYFSVHGQYENQADPGTRLGDQSTRSVNGELVLTPTSNLTLKYFGQYFENRDGLSPVAHLTKADFNCNAGAAPAGTLNYICGVAPEFAVSRLGQNTPVDQLFTDAILHNSLGLVNPLFGNALGLRDGGLEQQAQHHHLSVAWTVPGAGIVIRSLTAVNSTKSSVITDLDLADTRSIPNVNFGVKPNTEAYVNSLFNFQSHIFDRSQELRVESAGNHRVDLLLGGSYVYASTASSSAALLATGPSNQLNGNPVVTKTTGIFGSASFKVTEQIVLSAESRYQIDNITLFNRGANNGPLTKNIGATFHNFLPRVIAKWQFTPDLNVYASYSKAANPGTFNANFIALTQAQRDTLAQQYGAGTVVQPEKLDNYEIGAKSRFWGGGPRSRRRSTMRSGRTRSSASRSRPPRPMAPPPSSTRSPTSAKRFSMGSRSRVPCVRSAD